MGLRHYLRAGYSWLYLTVVIDLFDISRAGMVVCRVSMSALNDQPRTFRAVVNRSAQPGLIFHSDRGVQYCAASFRERLRELSGRSPEHEPERQLLGQRLRRIIFQNVQTGVGNSGRRRASKFFQPKRKTRRTELCGIFTGLSSGLLSWTHRRLPEF